MGTERSDARQDRLRLLIAELESELTRIQRLVDELGPASVAIADPHSTTLVIYGAAALLESFYTGMEKALRRIASSLGGMPTGEGWHRDLLASMTLAIGGIRPAVLADDAARSLEDYLAFRHRFRNLYVFDLERAPMASLLARGPDVYARFERDLRAFIARLDRWVEELEADTN